MRRVTAMAASSLGQAVRTIPNIAVFCLLLGLGYWGHEHRWKIPKFSALSGVTVPGRGDAANSASEDSKGRAAQAVTTYRPNQDSTDDVGLAPDKSVSPAIVNAAGDGRARLPLVAFASQESVRKSGIQFARVASRPIDEYRMANGVVDYDHTRLARLSSRVPGVVWRVERRAGESVKKGDVLAIIDSADVGKAKAAFLESVVLLDLKDQTLRRLQSLPDTIAKRRVEEAEADWRAASIHRFNAQQALINMGLPIRIEEVADLSLDELTPRIQFLGLPESIVATIRPETLSANLIPLVSSLDGVIISRDAVTGETVKPSEPLFVVADIQRMYLQLDVRAEDINDLMIGQQVLFRTDGCREEVRGTLSWIGTEVDERTRTVQVRAEVSNPVLRPTSNEKTKRRVLHANSYGTARIRVRERPDAITVPSDALQRSWNGAFDVVFVPLADGRMFEPRRVLAGMRQRDYVEILEGLADGETVVTAGSRLLRLELDRASPVTVGDAAP